MARFRDIKSSATEELSDSASLRVKKRSSLRRATCALLTVGVSSATGEAQLSEHSSFKKSRPTFNWRQVNSSAPSTSTDEQSSKWSSRC